MFEVLLWLTIAAPIVGMLIAWDGSRDIFHPLMYLGPMCLFLYGYMPLRMHYNEQLATYFTEQQLIFIGWLNFAGVVALVIGCLAAGCQVRIQPRPATLSPEGQQRLFIAGAITGSIGLAAWSWSIINVGGFVQAFSRSYGGGWDDSGYIRDAALLLLVGVLLLNGAIAYGRPRLLPVVFFFAFATPWFAQAMLTGRRGPTFTFSVMAGAAWFLYRNRRPPVVLATVGGLVLGWFIMFLVANRNNIYIGSDFELSTDVAAVAETSHTGNEFVYGTGTVLSAQKRGHYYWGRRYLAQILVRPVPSAVWPTKYEDFGVPELLKNAGTGEGLGDAMGWEGAPGSAPGIIGDLWLEFSFGCVPVLGLIGFGYGRVWRTAITRGGVWFSQYAVLFALAIYLIMQTGEAVIFRLIILSLPVWFAWKWSLAAPEEAHETTIQFSRASA